MNSLLLLFADWENFDRKIRVWYVFSIYLFIIYLFYGFRKYDTQCDLLGHERNMNSFPIELGGHLGGILNIPTIHEPESGRHSGGEWNTILDKREWGGACHVFPLSSGRAAWEKEGAREFSNKCLWWAHEWSLTDTFWSFGPD